MSRRKISSPRPGRPCIEGLARSERRCWIAKWQLGKINGWLEYGEGVEALRCRERGLKGADTAPLRNRNYHRSGDTPDTLDYQAMAAVTTATVATARGWQTSDLTRDQGLDVL